MASRKSYEDSLKWFTEHAEANRNANKFRDATKDLLVNSKQVVLTLTIDPCSKQIIVTGESSIVKHVEKKGFDSLTLSDICAEIQEKSVWHSENNSFSELHNGIRKDFDKSEPVARLPTLKYVDPKGDDGNGWHVLLGRKVVGLYMTDIKHRENLKYNKNKNKKASWLPKDVDKLYNANMTKDESIKVMESIMETFPEVKPIITSEKGTGRKRKSEFVKNVSDEQIKKKEKKEHTARFMHEDLRKKLYYGKRLNLVPKIGWEAWENQLVMRTDCSDSRCLK